MHFHPDKRQMRKTHSPTVAEIRKSRIMTDAGRYSGCDGRFRRTESGEKKKGRGQRRVSCGRRLAAGGAN